MRRGDLYLVRKPTGDAKAQRVFVVVSRSKAIESSLTTLVCAPVYTHGEGLLTQVRVGIAEGLKHESWIWCDELASVPRSRLSNFVGSLRSHRIAELNRALRVALDLD